MYSVTKLNAPRRVEVGEKFDIEVRVCCEGTSCEEEILRIERRTLPTGPLGFWKFRLLATFLPESLVDAVIHDQYEFQRINLDGGKCKNVTVNGATSDEAGEWMITVRLPRQETNVRRRITVTE